MMASGRGGQPGTNACTGITSARCCRRCCSSPGRRRRKSRRSRPRRRTWGRASARRCGPGGPWRLARHRARADQHVGVARAALELDAEPLEVVAGRQRGEDLDVAPVARPAVEVDRPRRVDARPGPERVQNRRRAATVLPMRGSYPRISATSAMTEADEVDTAAASAGCRCRGPASPGARRRRTARSGRTAGSPGAASKVGDASPLP